MELTQKLECTQELYSNTVHHEVSDQIGFLGICGVKYPLKKGPNKIGRDPNTCSIILNLNSISRQHAVINILNSCDFMLMDLDSANKTKLADKTLQAYIPTPLKNGDMVQFGQVFGVFRLFEEDNELPMTQALDIPDTPVRNQHVSKLNLITTIPESPEVSDKDDSFIVASQQKSEKVFKSPNANFIKSSGKTIIIKPVGSKKIDNVYWSSSKKSDSFNLESDTSMNTDTSMKTSNTKENIHEQDTQVQNNNDNFIYEADTQIGDNIPPFYNKESQLSRVDNLPEVHKVHDQENVNIDLFTENKENYNNIHNSETQDVSLLKGTNEESKNLGGSSKTSDVCDDIILFDEIESPAVEESFESQDLLLPELEAIDQIGPEKEKSIEVSDGEKQPLNLPISNRRDSGSSTDCEDFNFALTQNIPEIRTNDDDDTTDCEDAPEQNYELNKNHKAAGNIDIDDNLTDCENEIENNNRGQQEKIDNINFEDLATQIIEEIPSHYNVRPTTSKNIPSLEDLPTQVIDKDMNSRKENSRDQLELEDLPTQIIHEVSQNVTSEQVNLFKVPGISPFQRKKKDHTEKLPNKGLIADKNIAEDIDSDDEEQYYAATQELLNDLCTQRELSPEIVPFTTAFKNVSKASSDNNQSKNKSTEDIDEKIDKFVMDLTNSVIKDVDVEEVSPLKKLSSDSSDFESTPKKIRPLSILETQLPNTPEIKKYLKQNGYASTESSKGSDTDCSSHSSPYKKKTCKVVQRVDLTTQFEPERLPEKVTRVRKPKMLYTENSKQSSNKMPHLESFETDHSIEKETVVSSNTFTSGLKKESKKQTNKTGSKKNNVSQEKSTEMIKSKENVITQEKNKSKEYFRTQENNKRKESVRTQEKNKSKENFRTQENNKRKESVRTQEKNKSKENVRTQEKNKSKENVRTQENNKSKENAKIRETNKSKKHSKSIENVKSKDRNNILENVKSKGNNKIIENNKSKGNIKSSDKNNENTDEIENKSEQKSTRKSSRKKDKQHEVRKEPRQLTVKTDEEKPLKTDAANSIRESSRRSHSKTNRKESNTIDKYLSSTSAEAIQRDETTATERRSRRSKNEETTNCEATVEIEVRRSKRQRTAKRSFDEIKPKPKPFNHEQSAVYNMSSESGLDSPNNLKRQASDLNLPTAKKTKTINSSNVVLRSTPARKTKTHVLFTAFPCEEVKVKLEKLGAVVVTDIMQCTVVLTLQIRRTFKLLCAVGLGKPIVGPNWVQACVDTNMIVDPWLYLMKDELTEKRFQFNLERTLLGDRQFLKGYNVSSTPNIMPSPPEMKLIVECSGGTWNNGGKNWICISSKSDKPLWASLKRRGATVVSSEFILGGVLRQAADVHRNTLA